MTIEFGAARRLGIVAMPDANILQTDRGIELGKRFLHSVNADNLVAGNVHVAGIDAGADRNDIAQQVQDFRDLFKTAAQRVLEAGGVFDEHGQSTFGEIKASAGNRNRSCDSRQPLFPAGAPE